MATMTATMMKPIKSESKVLDAYHHPQLAASHQAHSNYSFPYLGYKGSPDGLPLFEPSHKSSSLNSTEAFILKSNLILRSSSLYDNSNYRATSRNPSPQSKFAHPDFVDSPVLAKPTVMTNSNNNLPRVEVAKVSRAESGTSNKSVQSLHRENAENRGSGEHRRPLERLSPEETQQLSRLIFKHFANNRKVDSLLHDPVPADYNEEDPQTWPSNWLSQAPAMIIEPDKYLAQKPMLNSYQRQLIRRISRKYEPLVLHYLQQLLALRAAGVGVDEARKSTGAHRLNGEDLGGGNSASAGRLGKPRPSLVKSASLSSALSSQARIDSINSAHQHNGNGDLGSGGYCHREAGTLLSSTGVKPEPVNANSSSSSSHHRALKSYTVEADNGRPSPPINGADLRPSALDSSPPLVSSSRSPKMADRENRLTRLSQQMANKWSNKMKIYLRKN